MWGELFSERLSWTGKKIETRFYFILLDNVYSRSYTCLSAILFTGGVEYLGMYPPNERG